jgi:hypothetical protein
LPVTGRHTLLPDRKRFAQHRLSCRHIPLCGEHLAQAE